MAALAEVAIAQNTQQQANKGCERGADTQRGPAIRRQLVDDREPVDQLLDPHITRAAGQMEFIRTWT